MNIDIAAIVAVVLFLALLGLGRSLVAEGSNAQVANGAVVLVLATLVGMLALRLVV